MYGGKGRAQAGISRVLLAGAHGGLVRAGDELRHGIGLALAHSRRPVGGRGLTGTGMGGGCYTLDTLTQVHIATQDVCAQAS